MRKARDRAGLTQMEVATRLGVQPVTVSRWERGENPPDKATLQALSRLYAVDLTDDGSGLLGMVPRGTSAASEPRPRGDAVPWERVVATDDAEDWLDAYRKRLRPYVRDAVQRDRFVDMMRQAGAGFSADGSLALWTVKGAIEFMDRIAERVIDGLKQGASSPAMRLVQEDDGHTA